MPKFEIGTEYTRNFISACLGGSVVNYLPRVGSEVVCACLKPAINGSDRGVVFVGPGPERVRSAKHFMRQGTAVPVFRKRAVNRWVYDGMWRCVALDENVEAWRGVWEKTESEVPVAVLRIERVAD